MALADVVVAWMLVAGLFVGWEVVSARLDRAGNAGGWLRAPARIYIAEALFVTLLGTLWFASLGSGGWPIVFALLGILMEWPGAVRHGLRAGDGSRRAVYRVATGVARVIAAGAVLWWWVG